MRRAIPMALAASLFEAGAAHPAVEHLRNVNASLVSEDATVVAGRPFWIGLHLQMAPGWHTYWKNPGDSGLATRLRWNLPDGFSAGPVEWPFPQRFAEGPLVSYGYEGEVLLLTRITPPSRLPAGTTVRLAARADWLECREACLPGKAELALALPTGPGQADSRVGPLFAQARERLPQSGRGWAVRPSPADLVLSWTAPPGPDADAMQFFPETQQLIAYGAPQTLSRTGKTRSLRLIRDPNAVAADRLTGILVTGEGPRARAHAVDVPLTP